MGVIVFVRGCWGLGGCWVQSGSLGSCWCAIGVVGFILGRCVRDSFGFVGFIRVCPGGCWFDLSATGGRWVHLG